MSKSKLIEKVLDAIDNGEVIDVDLDQIQDPKERAQVAALLKINQVSSRIKTHRLKAQADVFQPNDQWLHLIIQEKVGSGGFGQVYRAYDTVLETDVAVKFLNKDQSGIEEQEFLKEARLMATVRNPHVLAIHGAAIEGGMAGYWSDYLNGMVLYDHLQESNITTSERMVIVEQLAQAIKATHDNGVVHGDIKSMNVVIQPNRGAILVDFGAGRLNEQRLDEVWVQASPISMAPEQYEGLPSTHASDVYSFGLLIFEIFTGKSMIHGLSQDQLEKQTQLTKSTVDKSSIPKDWKRLLLPVLDRDPNKRPDINQIVSTVEAIKRKPLKQAKTRLLIVGFSLMFMVLVFSLYHSWSIKQSNQQTQVVNEFLADTFLSFENHSKGLDVKLIDILASAEEQIFVNESMWQENKITLLKKIAETYTILSSNSKGISLIQKSLDLPDLKTSDRMMFMRLLASMKSELRDYQEALTIYDSILQINATTKKELNERVLALSSLFSVLVRTNNYQKIPGALELINEMETQMNANPHVLAKLAYIQGIYHRKLHQYGLAYSAYQKSAKAYKEFMHDNHFGALTSEAMAAVVLSNNQDKITQSLDDLQNVIIKMEQYMGPKHDHTLIVKMNQAMVFQRAGMSQKSLDLLESLEPSVREKYGATSLFMINAFNNQLAKSLAHNQQWEKGEQLLLDSITQVQNIHASNLKAIHKSKLNLLQFYQLLDLVEPIKSDINEYIESATKDLGQDHIFVLEMQQIKVLLNNTDASQSLIAAKKLYEEQVKLLGKNHPLTVTFLEKIKQHSLLIN